MERSEERKLLVYLKGFLSFTYNTVNTIVLVFFFILKVCNLLNKFTFKAEANLVFLYMHLNSTIKRGEAAS